MRGNLSHVDAVRELERLTAARLGESCVRGACPLRHHEVE
jgi:hypothetical protein